MFSRFLPIVTGIVLALSVSLYSQTPPQQGADTWPPPGVHPIREAGVAPPRVLREVKPQYTAEAMRARIEGSVLLEAVVGIDGRVGAIHIVRSLDALNGLDEQAVRALQQWTFTPGTKDGVAVPVLISVQLSFASSAPLTLPKAFSPRADGQTLQGTPGGSWQEASVDDSGMRIKVSYPNGWNASTSRRPSATLLRVQRLQGRATDEFQLLQLRPAPPGFNLNASIGRDKLQQFSQAITQTLGQHGGALQGSGQTRFGSRFWMWAEVHGPAPDAGREDVDFWVFSTGEGDRVLQVACWVLMPKGSTSDETAAEIQSAAGAFVEMLKRLTIEPLSR
jgi:TonB family protein